MTNAQIVLAKAIHSACAQDPSFVQHVIHAATTGVQEFANTQTDRSSKMAFMMTQILSDHPDSQFVPFSRKEVLDALEPNLGGTVWHNKELRSSTRAMILNGIDESFNTDVGP